MSEGGGNYYKKFGGLDDNFHNQTIFIDNLVSKSLTSATVPINLPENLKLWIKSDTDDLSGLVEVRNDLGYTINTTLIDESKGDLVGNGSRLTGAAIDDTVFNYNLWPVKQNASIGGLSAVNRNLKTVEISGSLVHGEVGSGNASKNSIEPYTHSHVHGTVCSVSGDYAHVMGKGNYVSVSGKYAHVEGSGNIAHDEYGHILGDGCSISSDISGSHIFGKDVSLNTNGEAMGIHIEGQEISISAGDVSASYSYGFGKSNLIEGYGTHVLGVDTKAIGDYSYVAGNSNIAGGRASTVFGISNEIKPHADYTFLTGYNLVCNSGNSHATIVGQYNDLSDSDMEKGENLLFAVGTGHGLHDASRANMMFVSDKKVGIHKINTIADISASQCEILRSKYQQQRIYAPHFLWEKKAYLQLPETNSTKFALLNPQNAFSFSVWIQLDSVGTGTDISNHVIFSSVGVNGTTNNSGYELRVLRDHDGQFLDNSFNRIEWLIYTTNTAGAAGTVSVVADVSDILDNWVHVAGTVSSANPASGLSKSSLYVNGAFAAESGSTDWTFTPNTSPNAYFTVGRNSAAGGANSVIEYMNGYLYDLRLFSRVITLNNIMTIYVDDNLNTAIGDEVLHLPLRHQNNPGFTMSSTSFLIATYGNIAASTPYIYAPIVEDNIRKTIISDGNICVKHNWDVSKVAIECDESIQARAFYGDGKYLKGGTTDVKGWKISESVGTRKDYFVSCVDISCIDVVDTAFKRDIDIVSLIDLSAEFVDSSGIIGDQYTIGGVREPVSSYDHHHRHNQEYVFVNSNNHDISYNISHSSYYGKGMQTRMSFIPHRNIPENSSILDIPDISINQIDISSSETSGNVVDILYSAKRTVKIYTKPLHKDLDDVIITDVSGTERAIFQVVSTDVSANNLDGPYNYYPCIDPLLQRVYIGSENGKIYAYSLDKLRNPGDGLTDPSGVNSLVWSFTITDGPGNAAGSGEGISVRGLAIGANNVIYATVSDSVNKWGALYAISSNGTKNWRYLIQSTANKFQIETMPAVDCTGKTKKIYFGDDEGFIHSLTDIGSNYILNWRLDLVAQICTSCAIDNNGIIYVVQSVPAPSTLYAINPEGTVRWKYNMTLAEAGLSFSTPAIDTENNVYLFTGSDNKADPNHFHIFKVADVNGNAVLRKHTRLGDYPFIDVSSSLINSASNTYYYPKDFITSPVIDNDGSVFFTHGYVLTKLNRDLTTTDWSFNVFDISNTFYGGNLVDNSTFYFVKEPMISLDGYVYVTCANKLLRFNADGNTGVIDTSYQLIENGKTRCSPVMLNSRGQWGMFGFDCTRRGKRFPIF